MERVCVTGGGALVEPRGPLARRTLLHECRTCRCSPCVRAPQRAAPHPESCKGSHRCTRLAHYMRRPPPAYRVRAPLSSAVMANGHINSVQLVPLSPHPNHHMYCCWQQGQFPT